MRNIRSIIFLFTLVLALGAFAVQSPAQDEHKQADQGTGGHGKRGQMPSSEAQLKHLTEVLNLTDNQQTAVKAILDDTHKQAETVAADKSLSPEDQKTKMRTLHESAHAKIRDILNDDQKKKFDELRQQHMRENQSK
jgi:Spy/CpxP family protein refolding chaperone